VADIAEAARAQLPRLRDELVELVRIPSISGPGRPIEPLGRARAYVSGLLEDAGADVRALDVPDANPIVIGEIPAPEGAPTVLLYSHYDVVGPGDESLWASPPFEPSERDGAIYGRGSADSKANIITHVGALRAWGGRPPVGITIVIEGDEETGGKFDAYPRTDPELFACDAMLIADAGSLRPGVPTLTVALRGMALVTVEVATLAGAKHSGQFGGAAPDALLTLLHALATLHDEHGDVAVEGLRREPWAGSGYGEDEFRELAAVLPGKPLLGTGGLGERLWSGPSITVTGIDAPSVADAVNAVVPYARACISLRVHPAQDAVEGQAALVAQLERVRPFGMALTVTAGVTGNGFAATTTGPAYQAARESMQVAWGVAPVSAAVGGSIPLVNALAAAAPNAEILLVGACDGYADIHAPNERVLLSELEAAVVAEAEFFGRFAKLAYGASRT